MVGKSLARSWEELPVGARAAIEQQWGSPRAACPGSSVIDASGRVVAVGRTQHPCLMCAAAVQFIGIGQVRFVADDPSDVSPPEAIAATRGRVPYEWLGDPLWWTVSNLLFLYYSAVQSGETARNLRLNRDRHPALVELALRCAQGDMLGHAASSGTTLVSAIAPYHAAISSAGP